jgi:hypothetical protein
MKTYLLLLIVACFDVVHLVSAEENAADIIAAVHVLGPAPVMRVDATMTIREGSSESERRLQGWYERADRELSLFVQIVDPPFLREMKLLLLRNESRDDNWMRTSRGVRRLGASSGNERVFGSHFTVSDMTAVDPAAQTVRLVSSSPEEIVIDVYEGDGQRSRRFAIAPDDKIIRSIAFFDAEGTRIKEYELLSVDTVAGRPVPMRSVMRLPNGDQTMIVVNEIEFPQTVPRRYFSRGNL